MASFVGTWETKRHRQNDLANPTLITLTIAEDSTPGSLDGSYPLPGQDARLFGAVDATGNIWTARIDEIASTGDQGDVVFVLTADGNTMYGSWNSQASPGPLQPWFATRVQTTRK